MKLINKCFLCSSRDFKLLYRVNNYKIVRCVNCQLVITLDKNYKRSYKSNLKIYTDKDYLKYYLSPEVQKMLFLRSEQRLKEITKYTKGKKILDIGCSYGFFLKTAKEKGWQAEGIEPCLTTVNYLRKHTSLTIYKGTLSSCKLKKQYNIVTYWDVLEHIGNPLQELKKAGNRLEENGLLVVQSPNINSLSAKISREHFGFLCPEDHLNHFSPQTLKLVLTKAGFEILEIKTISANKQQFSQLIRDFFPRQTDFPIIRLPLLGLALFIDRFLPFMDLLFIWIQSLFLVNDIVIVYAKKNNLKR